MEPNPKAEFGCDSGSTATDVMLGLLHLLRPTVLPTDQATGLRSLWRPTHRLATNLQVSLQHSLPRGAFVYPRLLPTANSATEVSTSGSRAVALANTPESPPPIAEHASPISVASKYSDWIAAPALSSVRR